jgi:hypothetical protein
MAKVIDIEKLSEDTQRVLEEVLSTDEPVLLSRSGKPLGGMVAYSSGKKGSAKADPSQITKENRTPPSDGWRRTVGAFDADPIMEEIVEAGKRIREAERREK